MLNGSGKLFMWHSLVILGKHFERWLRFSKSLLQCSFKWNICIFVLASNSKHNVLSSMCNLSYGAMCSYLMEWKEIERKRIHCQLSAP